MENVKVRFFSRIYKSITDFSFYSFIKKETLGKAFTYLLLLTLLISLVSIIKPIYELNSGVGLISEYFDTEVPYFELKNGELNVEGDMPIVFEDEDSIMIINTERDTDVSLLDDYDRGFIVTKYGFINKKSSSHIEKVEFSQLKDFTFNKYDVEKYIPYLKFINIFIIIFLPLFIFIGKLFSTLFISLLGLIVNSVAGSKLEYADIYKIGIYSITLPSIIKLLFKFIPFDIPFFNLIYYGIVVVYMYKAMTLIKLENKEIVE